MENSSLLGIDCLGFLLASFFRSCMNLSRICLEVCCQNFQRCLCILFFPDLYIHALIDWHGSEFLICSPMHTNLITVDFVLVVAAFHL